MLLTLWFGSGQLWRRLTSLHSAGHLLGALYKTKYAQAGDSLALGLSEAALKAARGKESGLSGGGNPNAPAVGKRPPALLYPIVELREVDGAGYVKLRNPWAKVGDAAAPEYKGEWSASAASWQNAPAVAEQVIAHDCT